MRLLLPTVALFAAALALVGWAALELYTAEATRAHRERAELFAGMVAGSLTTAMLDEGPRGVPAMLALAASARADVNAVSLLRPDGVVAFSSLASLEGERPWPRLAALPPGPGEAVWPAGGDGTVIRPVLNAEGCMRCHGAVSQVNGWVEVRFSEVPVAAARARLGRTLAWTGGPALLLLLGIAWWLLGREVVRPLARLVAAMRRAERGDLQVRADEGRPDELGFVARRFDATLAALRRSQEMLEAFYRERVHRADRFAAAGELATALAHEIKNPLAGISGALELLEEDLAGDRGRAEIVREMRRQAERLGRIMESLLGFARPPSARLAPTDVNGALGDVLFLVEQQCNHHPIEVQSQLDPHLPPAVADPEQIEQVFLNLCLNAVQSMASAPGALTVRSWLEDDRVVVTVADTGPGIPEHARPRVFEPFFTTKQNGTGLGLSISARIVSDCGGRIDYRCPPEGGTIFRVELLRAGAEERAA